LVGPYVICMDYRIVLERSGILEDLQMCLARGAEFDTKCDHQVLLYW